MVSDVQPAMMLLIVFLLGVLFAYRATVVGLALLMPVVFAALWFATGSLWLALIGFAACQVGYILPTLMAVSARYFFPVATAGGRKA